MYNCGVHLSISHISGKDYMIKTSLYKTAINHIKTKTLCEFRGVYHFMVNSLIPVRSRCDFKYSVFYLILLIGICRYCYDNALKWMPHSRSQHWFRRRLGAIMHQAMTWTSIDQDLRRHIASLDHNYFIDDIGDSKGAIFCLKIHFIVWKQDSRTITTSFAKWIRKLDHSYVIVLLLT